MFTKVPSNKNTREKTIFILFELKTHWRETAEMIQGMWIRRKQIIDAKT